jgi:hypothetical protein
LVIGKQLFSGPITNYQITQLPNSGYTALSCNSSKKWVKEGILLGFRIGAMAEMVTAGALSFVVVPGSRAVNRGKAAEWGLLVYAPVTIKYRDEKTDRGSALEELLR